MSEAVLVAEPTRTRARRRRPPLFVLLCFIAIAIVLIAAVFGPLLAPQDPEAQNVTESVATPSSVHWLGTDELGRDNFSRLIVGARTALVGPLVIALVVMLCGNLLGLLAGYRGGRVDSVIMRWVDLMWSIPALLVIIVVEGSVGGGYWLAVALLALLTIPFDTRVVRGATLEQVPRPYVESAKALGVSDRRIMLMHIWPNVSAAAVANAFLVFAASLVALSGLSFLGLGVQPGTADWGLMLAEGQSLLFTNPVGTLAPGVAIVITAAAMSVIGDWLYEQISSRGTNR